MPVKTKVLSGTEYTCDKCKQPIPAGTWHVKDHTLTKTKGILLRYHTECPKK